MPLLLLYREPVSEAFVVGAPEGLDDGPPGAGAWSMRALAPKALLAVSISASVAPANGFLGVGGEAPTCPPSRLFSGVVTSGREADAVSCELACA
jgi:hypothetical protein